MTSTVPRFSLVIPAWNEEVLLPRLLGTVDRARERYHGGVGAIQMIVADNQSTDRTVEIARAHGCEVVTVEKRAIAAVRNGGARAARGEVLAFVDADIQVHPETFNEIDRVLAGGKVVGGATGITFERSSVGLACTYGLLVMLGSASRIAMRSMPSLHVDTGVVFCWRSAFEQVGGYNDERYFIEDVQLLIDLLRLGRTRGQHLARGTKARAIFSTRKFDTWGDWHYFTAPLRLPWRALFRASSSNDFVRRYWYDVR